MLHKERLFRRDAETNTRDACATQKSTLPVVGTYLLRAFFESSGFAPQKGKNFAGEMK